MTPYLQNRTLHAPLIANRPSLVLGLVVVIPCYDEPDVLRTLLSLQKCTFPVSDVEVLVVINDSEKDDDSVKQRNRATYEQLVAWTAQQNETRLKFHVLYMEGLSPKHAGVGLARKIGMDEAVWRLEKVGNSRGIIVCFDADSRCQPNYLVEIERFFKENSKLQAASIHYEHPLTGVDFEDTIYESILLYELHLRYYVQVQRWAGFPYAYQTIGSSMAVRADAYQQQGGMNRRKAGEDFYFLQKFIELGKLGELTTTTVIPSPRTSHRVPFGTGKAVGEIMQAPTLYTTYAPQSFTDLKIFFELIPAFYESRKANFQEAWERVPVSVQHFLQATVLQQKIEELQSNTKTLDAFQNRFFRWFNAFQLMKYVHFARDHYYPNIELSEAVEHLCTLCNLPPKSAKEMLLYLRIKDKEGA